MLNLEFTQLNKSQKLFRKKNRKCKMELEINRVLKSFFLYKILTDQIFWIIVQVETLLQMNHTIFYVINKTLKHIILYVQEVVTQPKILNRAILSNLIHVT